MVGASRHMRGAGAALVLAVLCGQVVGCAGRAGAQEVALAVTDKVNESYEPSARVSGSPLVGLSLGAPSGALDVDDVRLLYPSAPADGLGRICVRATTLDGRYVSNTPYDAEKGTDVVRLSPLTRLRDKLAPYDRGEFAIRAYLGDGDDCSPADKLNLPALAPGGATGGPLLVMANGKSRSGKARLETMDAAVRVEAPCETPSGQALIAFDLVCALDPAALPRGGPARLVLLFDDGFGEEAYRYDVLLPPAAR